MSDSDDEVENNDNEEDEDEEHYLLSLSDYYASPSSSGNNGLPNLLARGYRRYVTIINGQRNHVFIIGPSPDGSRRYA